ncbi:spore cortex biosynthesis protein YabQ [Inconstantimicrobium porci]|uniref:Spore cortex biosynthesis protein YabQ n=1 Tax=Inconstantimicrobium porci TaxID=2652291 RepID=A0A7X2MXC6_9CLOT|nr:spore cortex biosynthesis protein YabQ [Inconstantimicrobium porci]MDD6769826.1 spore cortex biosynthesis protein YabQ [Inconstantimicrobium porci]MSR90819.1 spore cortex biosynthesis protein YabQ [Inconstantimicrobium porci]
MLLPIGEQFRIVLVGIAAGIIIGMLYDLYRVVRGNNVPKVIKIIEDTLFWILCAIVVFLFLLYGNYAIMGTYIYALIFIGFIIYLKAFSKFVLKVLRKIISGFARALRVTANNLSYSFRVIFRRNKSYKK